MKKIFTLIAAATMTANVMAQVEIVKVDEINDDIQAAVADPIIMPVSETMFVIFPETFGGKTFDYGTEADAVTYDASLASGVPSVVFEKSTANIDFKGVSAPQADAYVKGEFNNAFKPENQDFWDLTAEEGFEHPYRMYVKPSGGNPSFSGKYYWVKSEDGFAENYKYDEQYYELGCGKAPQKGCYYSFKTKSAGTMELAVYVNKPMDHPHVVLNVTDMKEYTKDQISLKGILAFRNKSEGVHEFKLNDGLMFDKEYIEATYPDYSLMKVWNKVNFIGYMTFEVEADKEYYVFIPKQQLGFYGYAFTPGGATGLVNVAVEAVQPVRKYAENGKIVISKGGNLYNVAGQLVK